MSESRAPTATLRALTALAALAALAALCACTLEPRYHQPPLPVVNRWPIPPTVTVSPAATPTAALAPQSAAAAAAPSRAARDIGWRDFFTDARLQRLIALALADNRDLRVAVLDVEQARAQYRVQRADLAPSIDASGSYSKEKLPAAITGFGIPITASYYAIGLNLTSFQLDLFGRVRSLTHAALEQYLAQQETRRAAQLTLIAEVANAYLTLASDRELQRLARQTFVSQQQSLELTSKRHDTGAASGLDLAQARTTVEQARADLERYGGVVQTDIDALTLLVGAPLDPGLLPADFGASVSGLAPLPPQLPSTVLLRRPDVLAAEHMLRADNADIGAARAAFFPTISLTGAFGTASTPLSGLFKSGSGDWTFTPQATLPIFQGGQLLGNLAAARAGRAIALAQYEKTIQSGFRDVADALALSSSLERERLAQQALVNATQRAYELSQARYRAGRDSYLNVLDSQRSYYAAQQGLISVRLAEQSNRVNLYVALGGGWLEHDR